MSDVIDELVYVNSLVQADFLAVVKRVPPGQRLTVWYGTWSLRDLIVHIATWDEVDAGVLRQLASGLGGAIPGWSGPAETDAFNARLVGAHAGESWDQSLQYHQVAIELQRSAAHALRGNVPLESLWAAGDPVAARVRHATRHRAHHLLAILDWEHHLAE